MRVIFLGTGDFALTSLKKLLSSRHKVIGVVTQPDKKRDRKGNIVVGVIANLAQKEQLPLFQFDCIKKEGKEMLTSLEPDIMVTASYGQILSEEILTIAPKGVINVHASLLPKYRGSSPIQWSIINGDKITGITIMQTDLGLDTGKIITSKEIEIEDYDTTLSLTNKLKVLGGDLLVETLNAIEDNRATWKEQDNFLSSKCKMLDKKDGKINWDMDSKSIRNLIRGLNTWPVAFTYYNNKMLRIFDSELCYDTHNKKNGTILLANVKDGLKVACGKNTVLDIKTVQLEGKNKMSINDFLKGNKIIAGDIFLSE